MNLQKSAGLIFLVGVVILGLGISQILSVPSVRQEIGVAEKQLVVVQQKNEKLSEILSQVKTVEGNAEAVRTALPASDEVPNLIMQFEQIAKQSGITVQHLGFGGGEVRAEPTPRASEASREGEGAEESRGEAKKVTLTAVVGGSYASLQTFLKNLEETSRVVNVTNFRFSPAQKEGEAELAITLGAEAFYLPGAESVVPETPLMLDITSQDYIDLIRKVKALRVYRPEVGE